MMINKIHPSRVKINGLKVITLLVRNTCKLREINEADNLFWRRINKNLPHWLTLQPTVTTYVKKQI